MVHEITEKREMNINVLSCANPLYQEVIFYFFMFRQWVKVILTLLFVLGRANRDRYYKTQKKQTPEILVINLAEDSRKTGVGIILGKLYNMSPQKQILSAISSVMGD